MADSIEINKAYLQSLRTAYNNAERNGLKSFMFRKSEFVTAYAKYLLEFYEPKFGITNKK